MNSVRAGKVVDPAGKGYGLEKPVWQVVVTEGDKKIILDAGSKDEKGGFVYVRRSGNPTVFDLSVSFFDDLNTDDTHFIKDASPIAMPNRNTP